MTEPLAAIADKIGYDGFAFVRAPEMGAVLEKRGLRDWASFAASWDDLGVDTYMADGGRYRRRRFAAFPPVRQAKTAQQLPIHEIRGFPLQMLGINRRAARGAAPDIFDGRHVTSPARTRRK